MKWMLGIPSVLFCCLLAVVPALAGPVDPLFTPVGSGYERLEFRTGKTGGTDWEVGVGSNTQSSGSFANAHVYDPNWWAVGKSYSFQYGINAANTASFSMDVNGDGDYADSNDINLNWANMSLGKTIQIHAKRDVSVTFAGIPLTGNASNPFGVDYGYVTIAGPFSYSGTINFAALGTGGSTQGVTVTVGNVVPIPGAVWLLGSALVGLVGLKRKFLA